MEKPTNEQIAQRAYYISLEKGGSEEDNWKQASKELKLEYYGIGKCEPEYKDLLNKLTELSNEIYKNTIHDDNNWIYLDADMFRHMPNTLIAALKGIGVNNVEQLTDKMTLADDDFVDISYTFNYEQYVNND